MSPIRCLQLRLAGEEGSATTAGWTIWGRCVPLPQRRQEQGRSGSLDVWFLLRVKPWR